MSKIIPRNIKTIFISGAAGFIGSHLTEKLILKGYRVIGVDNLSKGTGENLKPVLGHKNLFFIKGDVKSSNFKLDKVKIDVIVHLAAEKIPRYGNSLATLVTNAKGTEAMLKLAVKNKAKFILASTSDVYGKNHNLPLKEDADMVLGPSYVKRWSYAVSKIFDEHLCFAYEEEFKLQFVILRFFGVYGPKQHRSWWGGPQSVFIDSILDDEEVEIHGTGKQSRTFLYINDAIEAILCAIKKDSSIGQIINVGSKEEININNLALLIANLLEKTLKVKNVPYNNFAGKYEDIERKLPDINKAKKLLNWHPRIKIKTGFKKTIDWYRNNPK